MYTNSNPLLQELREVMRVVLVDVRCKKKLDSPEMLRFYEILEELQTHYQESPLIERQLISGLLRFADVIIGQAPYANTPDLFEREYFRVVQAVSALCQDHKTP